MKCPNCGCEIFDEKLCPLCGAEITADNSDNNSDNIAPDETLIKKVFEHQNVNNLVPPTDAQQPTQTVVSAPDDAVPNEQPVYAQNQNVTPAYQNQPFENDLVVSERADQEPSQKPQSNSSDSQPKAPKALTIILTIIVLAVAAAGIALAVYSSVNYNKDISEVLNESTYDEVYVDDTLYQKYSSDTMLGVGDEFNSEMGQIKILSFSESDEKLLNKDNTVYTVKYEFTNTTDNNFYTLYINSDWMDAETAEYSTDMEFAEYICYLNGERVEEVSALKAGDTVTIEESWIVPKNYDDTYFDINVYASTKESTPYLISASFKPE